MNPKSTERASLSRGGVALFFEEKKNAASGDQMKQGGTVTEGELVRLAERAFDDELQRAHEDGHLERIVHGGERDLNVELMVVSNGSFVGRVRVNFQAHW